MSECQQGMGCQRFLALCAEDEISRGHENSRAAIGAHLQCCQGAH